MVFFGIFILEFILLFFLSKKLIKSLSLTFFRITKSHKAVINILAIIFLPGTILHELAHLLTAGIMLVPVGEISVLPEIEDPPAGGGVKLGSVQIGKVDPFRLTIVGVAPVILGMLTVLGILYFGQKSQNFAWWQIVLGLYLIFEVANTMFSSKRDIEGKIGFVVGILVVSIAAIAALYFLRPLLVINIWNYLLSVNLEPLSHFFQISCLYLLVPLFLDLLIILLARPFTRHYQVIH